jgi:glycerol kinase
MLIKPLQFTNTAKASEIEIQSEVYALEGPIAVISAIVQCLRENLGYLVEVEQSVMAAADSCGKSNCVTPEGVVESGFLVL